MMTCMLQTGKRLECRVAGRVQGIMYRDFARRNAKRRGIFGTVQNLSDGTVAVIAEGDETKLGDFLLVLRKGPALARVDSVETKWSEATGTLTDFKIVYRNLWDRL